MPAAYWLIGRRIVEFEQSGEERAEYGAALMATLKEALAYHLGTFLLELGDDFCFMGREKRLRDPKIGSFSHADAGQMHFYLNYAK